MVCNTVDYRKSHTIIVKQSRTDLEFATHILCKRILIDTGSTVMVMVEGSELPSFFQLTLIGLVSKHHMTVFCFEGIDVLLAVSILAFNII